MTIAAILGSRPVRTGLRLAPVALAGLVLAACETIPPPPPPPPPAPVGPAQFNAADFAWSTQKGDNTIVGTVAYRPRTGGPWTCAGVNIGLTPQTRYSRDRMVRLYGSDVEAVQPVASVRSRTVAAPAPPEYAQFVQSDKCDAQNSFTFRNLPDGAYFVIAPIHPVQAGGGEEVVVMDRVEVYRGMVLRLTMPRAPAAAPGAARRP